MKLPLNREIGYVHSCKNYLVRIEGLPTVRINDIIIGQEDQKALVVGLTGQYVEAVLLTHFAPKPGDTFQFYSQGIELTFTEKLLGRTINPLGITRDDLEPLRGTVKKIELESPAQGINQRKRIETQLVTGVSVIDTLLPIGRGQRELIIGEPRSGKSSILLDMIAHQIYGGAKQKRQEVTPSEKAQQTICVYAAIGKSEIDTKRFIKNLADVGALNYSVIVSATSTEPAPLIAIAPSIALSIAEYFRDLGYDSLVVLDDLGMHAKYLREIALLSDRVPGRESYPGDVFYQQAQFLERGGNFIVKGMSRPVSITLLPVVESEIENLSSLIPTNLMATTDGHLFFSSTMRSEGQYPPIAIDQSVTRVGRQTQTDLFHELSDRLRLIISQYNELKTYSRFGSELTQQTVTALTRGELIMEVLSQEPLERVDLPVQAILLSLLFTRFFQDKDVNFVKRHKRALHSIVTAHELFTPIMSSLYTMKLDQLIQMLNQDNYMQLLQTHCRD